MLSRATVKPIIHGIRYFFPLVLLFRHLKHNLIGLLYWVFFFAIVTDNLGRAFGIPFLFLSPEYQGDVNFWSFVLLGFSFGGLTMAFNSYSYIRLGPHFPFLATVHKPFLKFCLNNAVIPVVFNVTYILRMIEFQRVEEFADTGTITGYICAYLMGFMLFVGIALAYFFPANKNFFDLLGRNRTAAVKPTRWLRLSQGKTLRYAAEGKHPLYWYIGKGFRLHQCRSTRHYSPVLLQQVFAQNRISTTIFEVTTVLTFVMLGLFGGSSFFDVPAAMSIVMLLTIILMLFSALVSWLKNWTYVLLIGLLLSMNYLSQNWGVFQFENQAYGLNYSEEDRMFYNTATIRSFSEDEDAAHKDSLNYIRLLNNWKAQTGEEKPVLFMLNTSGGGSRSATWMFQVMRYCDSLSGGSFSRHTALITGASGGMVGAAYYRSLLLRVKNGDKLDMNDPALFSAISEDLLNKLSFAASTNDIFFRYQSRLKTGNAYNYDRGMAFEEDLNENTNSVMDESLEYFRKPEQKGVIPVMIFSPTIVNDGRRLLISSQKLSFMTANNRNPQGTIRGYENIDIHQLLSRNSVDQMRFTSVLRMNATFPFVLPMVTLPTTPTIQIMDAGTRDNFGVKTMMQWINAMEDWIEQNTSGIVVIQIRDTRKLLAGDEVRQIAFLDKFSLPFSNVYGNFPRTQDFDQEELLKMATFDRSFPLRMVSINLREGSKDRISLSWHLTSKEKFKIKKAVLSKENQRNISVIHDKLRESKETNERKQVVTTKLHRTRR
jgi:hypothetical protein